MPKRLASRLHTEWLRATEDPLTFATTFEEVQPLSTLINWDAVCNIISSPVIMDPCAGEGAILSALRAEIPKVEERATTISNDINTGFKTDYHFDIINPEDWSVVLPQVDVFICSPPFNLLDAILPDLVLRATTCTICHTPGDYLQNGPSYRRKWWAYLQSQGRTAELRGLCRVKGRGTRRCSWLCIFATAQLRDTLWLSRHECFTLFT